MHSVSLKVKSIKQNISIYSTYSTQSVEVTLQLVVMNV